MKRKFFSLLIGAFVASIWYPGDVHAWVGFNGMNPHVSGAAYTVQPDAVPVPGTNVYIAPDYDDDIIFYHDYWYRVNEGSWDVARDYNGPWAYAPVERVPVELLKLPTDYRRIASPHVRIPYSQLKSNWKAWEEEKRWERHAVTEMHRYYRDSAYGGGTEVSNGH